MTQVGKMLMDEGRHEAVKKTAINMLKRGDSPESIAEVLELSVETIKIWGEGSIYSSVIPQDRLLQRVGRITLATFSH